MRVERVEAADELPMLDVYLPMMKAAAILAADELGLFVGLSGGGLSLDELARRLDLDPPALGRLADMLVVVGYLERTAGGVLRNSPFAARWLTAKGEVDYGPGLAWTRASFALMPELAGAVRRGGPELSLWSRMEARPELGALFSRYMQAFATHLSPDLVATVRLPPGATRLLDLGGSHGLHTAAFCAAHPALRATLVDFPGALSDTPATLRRLGLEERVELRAGDLRTVEWGEGYDVVLFLSVAHNQSASENAALFRRIGKALRPGGLLVVHEYLSDPPLSAAGAAFPLTLLVETGTRTWSSAELSGWMRAAGLSEPERISLSPVDKGTLLLSRQA